MISLINSNETKQKSFNEIKNKFDEMEAWGLLASIDVYECNPDFIRDADKIKAYINQLCDLIEMRKFGDSIVVHFGEDERVSGFSMVQLIETSLISGHFANQTNTAYIDIFSCKLYDPYKAMEFTKEYFQAKDCNIQLTYRK